MAAATADGMATPRTKQPPKYGMRASTIKYWQQQGELLARLRGYDYAVSAIAAGIAADLRRNNRDLAHRCISLAAVDPVRVKRLLLTGKATY